MFYRPSLLLDVPVLECPTRSEKPSLTDATHQLGKGNHVMRQIRVSVYTPVRGFHSRFTRGYTIFRSFAPVIRRNPGALVARNYLHWKFARATKPNQLMGSEWQYRFPGTAFLGMICLDNRHTAPRATTRLPRDLREKPRAQI